VSHVQGFCNVDRPIVSPTPSTVVRPPTRPAGPPPRTTPVARKRPPPPPQPQYRAQAPAVVCADVPPPPAMPTFGTCPQNVNAVVDRLGTLEETLESFNRSNDFRIGSLQTNIMQTEAQYKSFLGQFVNEIKAIKECMGATAANGNANTRLSTAMKLTNVPQHQEQRVNTFYKTKEMKNSIGSEKY
jgi:hypothetical protein